MKKMFIFSLIFLLTACNGTDALEKLKDEYPETVKKVIEELPKDIQDEIAVPTEFPFEVKNIFVYPQKDTLTENSPIFSTEVIFVGDEVNLHVYSDHLAVEDSPSDKEQIINLKDGTLAYIGDISETYKTIHWNKNGQKITMLFVFKQEKKFSMEDLIKIANSMEY
ncbi:hypothetical protein [Chengkuizengella sediminis]|uniref:hypothetical protein n=1 Tax=Chengkuizengella sediminis TaxID=1885917 RepID=UPI00138A3781|nr:hypothetical protein [Chengkuizengella sediminis]NDI33795.1 hypothetical protein [Chengkuizengella sediminis]